MKKSILQFSVIAAIAASMTLTTSCSSDDSVETFVPTPVQFTAGLNGSTVAKTRTYDWKTGGNVWANSSIGNKWVNNASAASADKVMLFSVKDKDGVTATAIEGYEYFVSDASNGLTATNAATNAQFYWMKSGEKKKVIAWSYGTTATLSKSNFDLDGSHKLSYTVESDQSSTTWNKELLWGYGIVQAAGTKDIPMYHQLARIDIQITAKDASNKASSVFIGRNSAITSIADEEFLALKGDFTPVLDHKNNLYNVTTNFTNTSSFTPGAWPESAPSQFYGDWSAETATTKQYITPHADAGYSDGISADTKGDHISQYSAVVIPQNHTASKFILFEITVDGVRYIYTPTTAVNWEPGKQYKYDITISPSGIDVTATIQAWSHTSSEEFAVDASLD